MHCRSLPLMRRNTKGSITLLLSELNFKIFSAYQNMRFLNLFLFFRADHKYFFELDRFAHKLSGEREETIEKEDKDSSLVWRVC